MELERARELKKVMEDNIKVFISRQLVDYNGKTGLKPWVVEVELLDDGGGCCLVSNVDVIVNL